MMRTTAILLLLIAALGLLFSLATAPSGAATQGLPAGFATTQIVSGLTLPTDMVFLPNGEILVTEKGTGDAVNGSASIRRVANGQLISTPVITLAANASYDSGLLALVLDPGFASNNHFYIWYATAQGSKNWSGESKLRLSRLTYDPATGTADPASEIIVLDNIIWGPLHHGNGLVFDAAGNLYIGLGDRTAYSQAQDFSDWQRGKIIRIRPQPNGSYIIPADNPFLGIPAIPDIIYSFGVRNPYRIVRRQSDGKLILGDVGESAWEEVNHLLPAKNYGWPVREGPCPRGMFTNCPPAGSGYTDPLLAYAHDPNKPENQSGAITGLAFYEGSGFPAVYQNKLFFADFNENFIAYASVDNPQGYTIFSDQALFITDMEYWLHGLYTLHIVNGEINYIYYQGGSNQIPTAVIAANPQAAAPATPINFSAAGSADPDDSILTYHWDFGDGSTAVSTGPAISYAYAAEGTYTARLVVKDPRGGSSAPVSTVVTIYSGEFPTIGLTVTNSPGRSIWHGGDTIRYEAQRSHTGGLDPAQPYRWQIDMHHNDHAHPIVTNQVVNFGTFAVPTDNHDHDTNIWYRFRLTMRTNTGQEIEVSRDMFPNVVNLTVEQSPGRSYVIINDISHKTPYTFQAIAQVNQAMVPSDRVIAKREVYVFSHWRSFLTLGDLPAVPNATQAPAAETYIFDAPAEDTTYVAEYTYLQPAESYFLSLIAR